MASRCKPSVYLLEDAQRSVPQIGALLACFLQALPGRFDWRDYSTVPEPRCQGDCASCYAFAPTGIVESSVLIHTHLRPDYMDLSEQLLETDDELKELVGESQIRMILDSLKAELPD